MPQVFSWVSLCCPPRGTEVPFPSLPSSASVLPKPALPSTATSVSDSLVYPLQSTRLLYRPRQGFMRADARSLFHNIVF